MINSPCSFKEKDLPANEAMDPEIALIAEHTKEMIRGVSNHHHLPRHVLKKANDILMGFSHLSPELVATIKNIIILARQNRSPLPPNEQLIRFKMANFPDWSSDDFQVLLEIFNQHDPKIAELIAQLRGEI